MANDQFENFVAGYSAGYGDMPWLYRGIRLGGRAWAVFGRQEHWTDRDSIPAIDAGFAAGRAARSKQCEQ